jgi:calcineurin-like phosphoesterase family protein
MKQNEKVDYIFENGENIFFTSDSHANHENIIKFCKRPFENSKQMDEELIKKWNEKVPKDGIVFHLGDFAWGGYNVWKNFREQLNGKIYLIKGNHCLKNLTTTAKELFEIVTFQMRIEIEGRKIWLNHFPLLCYSGTYRDLQGLEYNLFGHVHLSNIMSRNNGKDTERCLEMLFPTQYDVGVDFNDFSPISWYEVNEKIQKQIENNTNLKMWIKNE